jgi:DNA-binding winged helix-turn-helix (wHTH) protein/tetratricopeptide (TPR) repeat protein
MNPESDPGPRLLWQLDELLIDPVRRTLLRSGEPVAVTPKAFSILLALLERPGEVVTKQELIQKIWPDTFVTEANLTQNVSSLRKALGESANDRRYIVTVPGRGYSLGAFAVPIAAPAELPEENETLPVLPAAAPSPSPSDTAPALPPPALPVPSSGRASGVRHTVEIEAVPPVPRVSRVSRTSPPQRPKRGLLTPFVLALAVLAAAGVVWLSGRRQDAAIQAPVPAVAPAASATSAAPGTAPAAQRTTVAVLGFRNLSGDKEADWLAPALAEMLTTEMAAGAKVRVISGEKVLRARRSLSLPYTDHLESASLERLHSLLGADLVVVGAYLALGRESGQRLRLDLRVLKIPEGDTVVSLAEVGSQTELFDLVAKTGGELREALGFAGLSEAEERAVRALHPASSEAARLYTEGVARLRSFDPPAALDRLQKAVKLDPGSAVIHSALGQTWSVLGYDAQAVEEAQKALDRSASLPREERLAIEARLQEASHSWGKASEIYRSLWAFFPDDLEYGLQLATSLMMAGRAAEAEATIAVLRRFPEPTGQDPRIDLLEARIALRLADFQMQQRAAAAAVAKGRQSGERLMVAQALVMEGIALQETGRLNEAIERYGQAKTLAEKGGFQWVIGMALSNLGAALQSQGDLDGAEKAQSESLAIAQKLGTAFGIAAQYYTLGTLRQDRGDLGEAFKLFDRSRSWSARSGDRLMEARTMALMASIQSAEGDLNGALRTGERATVLSRETGSRFGEAMALEGIGAVLDLQDDLGEARRCHLRAFQTFRDLRSTGFEASALAAAADVTARLGDLPGARRRFEHALAAQRQAGDRLGAARILGSLADLAYESGDLAASEALSRDQLRIARVSGAKSIAAAALRSLGRLRMAAGDLAGAWSAFREVLQVDARLGEDLRATEVRLDLARVALADGRAAEAGSLAHEAAAWYGARGMRGRQAGALAVLAEAQLRAGSLAEARETAGQAHAQAEKSPDRGLRIAVAMRVARVEAASGAPGMPQDTRPLQSLRAAIAEAEKSGLVALALEARLALGEIQLARQDRQGLDTLGALRADAAARGFGLLARVASAGPAQGMRRLG